MKQMSTVEIQIAERSMKFPNEALTNLSQFINKELLKEVLYKMNMSSSTGIDNVTWVRYADTQEQSIPKLLNRFKSGKYKAPPVKRGYIPKAGSDEKRPLGIPTIEDKLLQSTISAILTPIYEQEFRDCSYGFRSNRSQHQALKSLRELVSEKQICYIIDADIQKYFEKIDHAHLRDFISQRINDGIICKTINKWLKAGVFEGKQYTRTLEGTPQGGSISPLLSNIYLHYVLDKWFEDEIKPLLKGECFLIRYADDFLLGFSKREDASNVYDVLPKRLGKFGLTLHPKKTKLLYLFPDCKGKISSFNFLGFTHFMNPTRFGNWVLKRKTMKDRLTRSLTNMYD